MIGIGLSSCRHIDGYSYKNVCNLNTYINEIEKSNFFTDLSCACTKEQHNECTMIFFQYLCKC